MIMPENRSYSSFTHNSTEFQRKSETSKRLSRPSNLLVERLSNVGSFPLIHNNKKGILKSHRKVIDLPSSNITSPSGRHSAEPADGSLARVAYEGSEVASNPGERWISGAELVKEVIATVVVRSACGV